MDLPVGTVIGDTYRITRLIGIGGMGAIYEAAHLGVGKRVAMKLMSKELAAHPEALARFRREVKVTTELAHPHIVDVFDFGASPTGEPYLVMEYLDGEDLEQALEREGRMPLRVAVQIVKQVASALAVAHAEGVVHRDLKPGNVFLLRVEGGGVFVKVVDFGISKVLKATTTKLTMARAVVGTPEFMAPEQAAGRVDQIDHRSDQWALACSPGTCCRAGSRSGSRRCTRSSNQVIAGEPTPLARDLAHCIPREVDKVLRRALSKQREDRFPTITAFARAFEAAATGKAGAGVVGARGAAGAAGGAAAPAGAGPGKEPRRPLAFDRRAGLVLAGAAWVFRDELPLPEVVARRDDDARRPPRGGPTVEPIPRRSRSAAGPRSAADLRAPSLQRYPRPAAALPLGNAGPQ